MAKKSFQDLKNGKADSQFTRLNLNQPAQYISAENIPQLNLDQQRLVLPVDSHSASP